MSGSGWMRQVWLTAVAGVAMRYTVGLEPVGWLVWLAPALVLWLALRWEGQWWRLFVVAACVAGYSVNAPVYFRAMPVGVGVAIVTAQALLWLLVVSETRRVMKKGNGVWVVVAYPVFWVAVDTLMARLLPDGNWGSLAYTQGDFLPLMQTASWLGVGGVLFVVCVVPSALVVGARLGWREKGVRVMAAGVVMVVGLAVGLGWMRLRSGEVGERWVVGLAAVDDAIGLEARPGYIGGIRAAYEEHVAALAAEGARLVVLPEKIAVTSERGGEEWQEWLAGLAGRHRVRLLAGIAVKREGGIANEAWLYGPEGRREWAYTKQVLAPPEREGYVAGGRFVVGEVEGVKTGIAICKDMHFARVGRENGRLGAGVMLVPAWDFGADGWVAARMTAVRGIENGYAVIRSAREGLLSVSDAYGRTIAEKRSAELPGSRLKAEVQVGEQVATVYGRVGEVFGWLCVAAAGWLMGWSRWGGARARG